jgi:hypothetical protein
MFDNTGQEVINIILQAGQRPCQLYYQGRSRVGCDPCIMCKHSEVKAMIRFSPESVVRLRGAEKEGKINFFPPGYIPARYCSQVAPNGKRYPLIDDVINYLTGGEYQPELFTEAEAENTSCMSFYGICE